MTTARVCVKWTSSLVPVVGGSFDECWVRAWPVASALRPLLMPPVVHAAHDEDATPATVQLDKSRGTSMEAASLLADRPTRYSPLVAPIGVLALSAVIVVTAGATVGDYAMKAASASVMAAVAGAITGAVVVTASTRERHLFRYFKER